MKAVFITFAVLALLILATRSHAETLEWVRQFGTSEWDELVSVSADELGNVFVAGNTSGLVRDAFLRRYDAAGALSWTQRSATAGAGVYTSVAADGLGNVYVSGHTDVSGDYDVAISKYDTNGTLAWTKQFGTDEGDFGNEVAADRLGNVYVSGSTISIDREDTIVSKLDADGTLLWTKQSDADFNDRSYSTAVDDLGNVYIAGIRRGNFWDAFVSKYDANGEVSWTQQFGADDWEHSTGVAIDLEGNVLISGITKERTGGNEATDSFVCKYDVNGTLIWTRQFGTSNVDDSTSGVATDALGNVFVTGYYGWSPNAGEYDAYVRMYDPEGTLVWTKELGTVARDFSLSVSTDDLGNVYMAGRTDGGFGLPSAGSSDGFVAKIRLNDVIIPGDTNGDGVVDLADLNNVRNHFGAAGGLGDTNGDNLIDLADLNNVRNHFGSGSATPVPEPASAWLLATVFAAFGALGLRR